MTLLSRKSRSASTRAEEAFHGQNGRNLFSAPLEGKQAHIDSRSDETVMDAHLGELSAKPTEGFYEYSLMKLK